MAKKLTLTLILLSAFILCSMNTYAQSSTRVSGSVKDAITGEPIIGATIIVKGRVIGSSTNLEGLFDFGINLAPPFTLIFSAVGYELREYDITEDYQELKVSLRTKMEFTVPFVKQASRKEESILTSAVTVQKNDIGDIRTSTSSDFYEGLSNLKDVQMTTSSLVFQSLNTRGFASIGNPRMAQMVDGVDNAPPGLNFSIGNLIGVSPLDVSEIEVVSGASSALYGPSAFNGIVFMNSKNPFDYTGLSAMMKNSLTTQSDAGTNPLIEMAFRYAEPINDNFAIKMNFSYLRGADWQARDYSDSDLETIINPEKGRGINPAYDGVNIYGDEIVSTFNIPTPEGEIDTFRIARTGYEEKDLTDYLAESFKFDASLHYRLTDDIELSAQYRLGYGNSQFQATNRYVYKDLTMNQFKLEAVGSNFTLRAYTSVEDAGNSYDMRFLSWNINRAWKSDEDWFTEYLGAYLGAVDPNIAGDHSAARAFADRDRLIPGTEAFQEMFDSISTLADLKTGSQIIDKSRLYHVEGLYDFTSMLGDVVDFVVGGNYRQYQLNSEGNLFNDAEAPINISQFGAYAQASKALLKDNRLNVLASIRYDKNSNFEGRFTPRASIVYSGGRKKEHNFRFTYQTGFRNPENQAQYIGLDIGVLKLLGGAQDNIDNYSVDIPYAVNDSTNATATVSGADVYGDSYTAASVQKFVDSGNPADLVPATVSSILPEQVTTFEVGYRGVFNKRFFLDLSYFRSIYSDFISNTTVVHPLTGSTADLSGVADLATNRFSAFQLYTNASGDVTSQGIGVSFELLLDLDFRLSGNYNYIDYTLGEGVLESETPGFNVPTNRFSASLSNPNIYRGIGFKISHRWSETYTWRSTFGTGEIPTINVTSLQFTYDIPATSVRIKVGGSNIFGNEYRTAFGAPMVGSQYFVQLTVNEF
ncbi:MAG: carboxypeptidase-like regulatory domain-containing protein [Saprospiraceae bacterium]